MQTSLQGGGPGWAARCRQDRRKEGVELEDPPGLPLPTSTDKNLLIHLDVQSRIRIFP